MKFKFTHRAKTNVGSEVLLRKVPTGWVDPNGGKFTAYG
jgi:hypothetical protein